MLHIVIFIIICGLIWEFIDRIKPKHNASQWSKEEREILEKQGSPPLKINRIPSSDGNSYRKAIDSIIFSINMEFYQNLEFVEWSKEFKRGKHFVLSQHPEGFYRSFVEYNRKKMWTAFYDIRQLGEALYKLASHFFKKEEL